MDPIRLFLRLFFRVDRFFERLNTFLSFLYISLVLAIFAITTYIYTQHLYPLIQDDLPVPLAALHTTVALYFLLTAPTNYLRCVITPAGSPPPTDPELATAPSTKPPIDTDPDPNHTRSETWRYCHICRAAKPPRAHHCSICACCYHRLCHHCPAMGRCIGRDNYPFFFRFVVSSWLGALYAAATAAILLKRANPGLRNQKTDMLFFVAVMGCAIGVAIGVLAAWHLYLLGTGQTTIEWLENVLMKRRGLAPAEWGATWGGPFNKGVRENVREAFGEFPGKFVPWWTILLLPVGRLKAADDDT